MNKYKVIAASIISFIIAFLGVSIAFGLIIFAETLK